jgi:hypothetical protein
MNGLLLFLASCVTPQKQHYDVVTVDGKTYDCLCNEESRGEISCEGDKCSFDEKYVCECLARVVQESVNEFGNQLNRWR